MCQVYIYFPWPITVEIFTSDFQRFYFRKRRKNKKNVKNVKNVTRIKKRKNVFLHLCCTVNWLDQTKFNVLAVQWQRGLGLFNVKRSIANVRPTCIR